VVSRVGTRLHDSLGDEKFRHSASFRNKWTVSIVNVQPSPFNDSVQTVFPLGFEDGSHGGRIVRFARDWYPLYGATFSIRFIPLLLTSPSGELLVKKFITGKLPGVKNRSGLEENWDSEVGRCLGVRHRNEGWRQWVAGRQTSKLEARDEDVWSNKLACASPVV
jgi:hypothetical protein